jgi:hypothetical protein
MTRTFPSRRALAVLLATALAPLIAMAAYPDHAIRMVVPYPPGGATDVIGRILATRLSAALNQQVVVENKGGASGNLGADAVAKAAPDGYTLLMAAMTSHATMATLGKGRIPYDLLKDLQPVQVVGYVPLVFVVHPSVPVSSFAQLVTHARANPGKLRGLCQLRRQAGFSLFLRKAFIKGAGYTDGALDRPVIGIADTGSDYNPCHGNLPQLMEAVQRGVMLAGGLPMRFPTISVHESFAHADQHVPAQPDGDGHRGDDPRPADGRGGADRRLRQDRAGAADGRGVGRRAGHPADHRVDADRQPPRRARGRLHRLPALLGRFRAGEIDAAEIAEVNNQLVASVGTCSVMGTASTMACIAEALGMTVPGGASPPAVTADRMRVAELTGAQAVQMARDKAHASTAS